MIYVNRQICINEFIIMIKNRFFKNIENVELEDIWLYRVVEHNIGQRNMQYFKKLEYSIHNYYDCPLFFIDLQNTTQYW